MPKRDRYLWVCTNERAPGHPTGSCAERGARELLDALKKGVAERGLKNRVRVCGSTCLDVCWAGVAIAEAPSGVFWGRVRADHVPAILTALETESRVESLELSAEDFDDPAKAQRR